MRLLLWGGRGEGTKAILSLQLALTCSCFIPVILDIPVAAVVAAVIASPARLGRGASCRRRALGSTLLPTLSLHPHPTPARP